MFYVIYNKSTKLIAEARVDNSSPVITSADQWLAAFASVKKFSANDYTIIAFPIQQYVDVVLGRDLFDEATNTIVQDPNWVEPTPVLAEPTA